MQSCARVGGTATASSVEAGDHSLNCHKCYLAQTFFFSHIRSWRVLEGPWRRHFHRRLRTISLRASRFWFSAPGTPAWFATHLSKASPKSWTNSARLLWRAVSRRSCSHLFIRKGWPLERLRCFQPTMTFDASGRSSTLRLRESLVPSLVNNLNAPAVPRHKLQVRPDSPSVADGGCNAQSAISLLLAELPWKQAYRTEKCRYL